MEMKLSKKNRKRQDAMRKAIAAGKPLGGILAGLLTVVSTGCRPRSPANTMGSYPNPNAVNEDGRLVPMGDLKEDTHTSSNRTPTVRTPGKAPLPKRRRRDASVMGKYTMEDPEPPKPAPTKPAETKPAPTEKTGK
jgi:hypothetical protein